MLTPIELQGKVFKTGFGYDKKDVEAFLKEVVENYEKLYKENLDLNDKINVLSEGVQYYKSIEKTLQKALVLAEKTAQDTEAMATQKAEAMVAEAEKKAALIEQEAYTKADKITANALNDAKSLQMDARKNLEQLRLQISSLVQQYEHFKIQYRQLLATQSEFLDNNAFKINYTSLKESLTDSDDNVPEPAIAVKDSIETTKEADSYEKQKINEHNNYIIREIEPEEAKVYADTAKETIVSESTEEKETSRPVMDDTFIPTIDLAGILEEAKKETAQETTETTDSTDSVSTTYTPTEEPFVTNSYDATQEDESSDYDYDVTSQEELSEQDLLQQLFSVNPKKKANKKSSSELADDFEFLDL